MKEIFLEVFEREARHFIKSELVVVVQISGGVRLPLTFDY